MNKQSFQIISRQGIVLFIARVCGVLGVLIGLSTPIFWFFYRKIEIGESIGAFIAGMFLILGVIYMFTVRVVLNQNRLYFSNYWFKQEAKWSDISKITVVNFRGWIPFLGFNIIIHRYSKPRGIGIPSLLFANSHILTKAIIALAHKANPDVFIEDILLHSYRKPPYKDVEIEIEKQKLLNK